MSWWRAAWESMERHPWRWTAAALAPLFILPSIDLTVSSWFYDEARKNFPLRSDPFFEWFRKEMPHFLFGSVAYVVAIWLAGLWLKDAIFGVSGRVVAFLLGSLALGPGLLVNLVLKDSWGRPRPSTIQEFDGPNYYVPPLVMTDQCDRNCSFASGHAALGFWVVAYGLLAPPRLRPYAVAACLAFGAWVGFARIAQGGHFLSDVTFSAVIVVTVNLWLYRRLISPIGRASPKNNLRQEDDSP